MATNATFMNLIIRYSSCSYFKVVVNAVVILTVSFNDIDSTTLLKHLYHSMELCVCFRHLHVCFVRAINTQPATAHVMLSV